MTNRFIRSNQNKEFELSKRVEIYIEFVRIGEIDTLNEKYQAEVNIEAKWETSETFDDYDPNVHWNPKLYIENVWQDPKESIKYNVSMSETFTKTVTEIRNVKGVFWERLELHNFPIDKQELSIIVTSKLGPQFIKLLIDNEKKSRIDLSASHTFIDQQKWKLYRLVTNSSIASYDVGSTSSLNETSTDVASPKNVYIKPMKSSKVVATCYCTRKAGYYLFNAYFLIFLITASAMTIFSIDPKLPQNRLQTTCTFLLTSVSFKWVINRSLPTISYLTSLDKYAIICIFFICCMCAWHGIVGAFWTKDEAKEIDKWVLVAFGILFVLIHAGFLIWYIVAYSEISKLKRDEKKFLNELKETEPEFKEQTRKQMARL